jgi:hypothetical protein
MSSYRKDKIKKNWQHYKFLLFQSRLKKKQYLKAVPVRELAADSSHR